MASVKPWEISYEGFVMDIEMANDHIHGPFRLEDIVARAGEQADIEFTLNAHHDDDDRISLNPQAENVSKTKIRQFSQELKGARSFSHELKVVRNYSQEFVKQELKKISRTATSVGVKAMPVRNFENGNPAASIGSSAFVRARRFTRQKSGAENALHGLRFISKTAGESNADFKVYWRAVEERFEKMASSEGLLSRADFGLCIGMKDSKEFALELFDALARRRRLHVQSVTKEVLHDFCLEISDQRFDSRLQIFFDMCDKNADGQISEDEVKEIIMLSASANQLSRIKDRAGEYAALIIEELDPGNKGYIELRQLQTLLLQGSGYGSECQFANSQTLSIPKKNPVQRLLKNAIYLMDDNWKRAWVMTLWFAIMMGLFVWKFIQYRHRDIFHVMGYCVCTAKGSAETLKLNMALILLPVCRNIITWLRSTILGSIVPFDDNINFHKVIAGAICVGVLIHGGVHLACDFPRIINDNEESYNRYIEPYLGSKRPDYSVFLSSRVGITGILMVLLMAIAFVLATSWFRRNLVKLPWKLHRLTGFNAFWYSHHSFVVVYVLLIVHSIYIYFDKIWWQKTTWMYIAVPLLLYCGERILRVVRAGNYSVDIVKAAIYPGNVLALHMSKPPGFRYKSGMYLFLKCPNISPFEWHPFSITSAPGDENISVHIRTVGDWTQEMKRLFSEIMEPPLPGKSGLLRADRICGTDTPLSFPTLRIDGPYGAPAQNYKKYDALLLIGLGIGATPFISILKDILNNTRVAEQQSESSSPDSDGSKSQEFPPSQRKKKHRGPLRAHFFWVTREHDSFDWFKGVMNEVALMDHKAAIEMHNYLTSVYEEGDARSALITMLQALHHAKNGVDILSGTRVKTHFARPNWKKVFQDVASANKDSRIGVFYCGPLILAKELKAIAKDFNYSSNTTKFEFHKENF